MKTIQKTLAALALTAAFISPMTSCSSDKENEPTVPAAKNVAGTYYGDLTSTVMGSESLFDNMSVSVIATDEATVTLTISEFGEAPMNMPSITVDGVKVSEAEDSYSLSPTEFNGTSTTGRLYSGTIQGAAADSKLNLQFTLNYGAMPMPLICSFNGSK